MKFDLDVITGNWLIGGKAEWDLEYKSSADSDAEVVLPKELCEGIYIHSKGLNVQNFVISGKKNGKPKTIVCEIDFSQGPMNVRIIQEDHSETVNRVTDYLRKVIEANFDTTE